MSCFENITSCCFSLAVRVYVFVFDSYTEQKVVVHMAIVLFSFKGNSITLLGSIDFKNSVFYLRHTVSHGNMCTMFVVR